MVLIIELLILPLLLALVVVVVDVVVAEFILLPVLVVLVLEVILVLVVVVVWSKLCRNRLRDALNLADSADSWAWAIRSSVILSYNNRQNSCPHVPVTVPMEGNRAKKSLNILASTRFSDWMILHIRMQLVDVNKLHTYAIG